MAALPTACVPPEHFNPSTQAALIAFAWATWLYRLVLFLGIAGLVYVFFFKLLGVILFAVEIVWFVLWPIRAELRVWQARWADIRHRARTRKSVIVGMAVCLLVLLPWPGRITTSAVLHPQESWPVFAPAGAWVEALPLTHGAVVAEGSPLVTLFMPDLASREKTLLVRLDQQRVQAATSGFDDEMRKRLKVAEQTLATTEAEWQGVQAERSQFQPQAPYAGRFFMTDPDLSVGQWVGKKESLGLLVKQGSAWRVETWLDEDDVVRVHMGQDASFWVDSTSGAMLKLKVTAIDQDAARVLPRRELAASLGGHVVTREKNGQLMPERAVYRVVLAVQNMPEDMQDHAWRGRVTIHAEWSSPAGRYLRQVLAVLVREIGF